ncbi:unnamed protein product, partial [Tetraodon nigroviridis]
MVASTCNILLINSRKEDASGWHQLQWVKHWESRRGRGKTRLDGLQASHCMGPGRADKYAGGLQTRRAIEVNMQKALAEASETCTQECLILGHSDSCWMPPAL